MPVLAIHDEDDVEGHIIRCRPAIPDREAPGPDGADGKTPGPDEGFRGKY